MYQVSSFMCIWF